MALSSKTAKSIHPPITAGHGQSPSKLLGPTNSKKVNGIETSKETVKVVPSRKGHQVRKDSFFNVR